jgi:hypothetical protein
MVWFRNVFAAAAVIAALTVFSASASAQSQVVTYSLAGVETAATSTEGTFVGVAISPDDFGTWGAVVDHYPLDDTALITGGRFAIDGLRRQLEGEISDGEVVRLGGTCRKETFNVTGHVLLQQDGIPTGEFGDFEVTLTHYGVRLPNVGCVTYFATIDGLITFTLTP